VEGDRNNGRDLVVVALSGIQRFISQSRTTSDLSSAIEIVARLAATAAWTAPAPRWCSRSSQRAQRPVGSPAAAAQGEGRHGGRVWELPEIEWIGGGWLRPR
jgi:hypothetical protein